MPGKSQSYSDAVLNVLRGTSITGVSPYLGLFSVAPADDSSAGTELTGNGYARQAVAFGVFDAQSSGNLLYWNTLATPKTIQQGDFGQFAPGSLIVEED